MIDADTQARLLEATRRFWSKHVKTDERLYKNRERARTKLMALSSRFDIELPIDQLSLNIK